MTPRDPVRRTFYPTPTRRSRRPALTEQQRESLRRGASFDVVPSREHIVEMSFAHLEEMTVVFMAMVWRLVRFVSPCLFSSSIPSATGAGRPPATPSEVSGLRLPMRCASRCIRSTH